MPMRNEFTAIIERPSRCRRYTQLMRKVEHIERQIGELSREEFAELREWVLARDWAAWDTQIEADAQSGKLDKLLEEARSDFKEGRTREL